MRIGVLFQSTSNLALAFWEWLALIYYGVYLNQVTLVTGVYRLKVTALQFRENLAPSANLSQAFNICY